MLVPDRIEDALKRCIGDNIRARRQLVMRPIEAGSAILALP
jgi:hypothetical protein